MKAISDPQNAAAAGALVGLAADRDQLRVLTCGSVDDGKSTLIGRLLLDASLVFEDHVAALTR
ncbi:MAG: sulfate adenylyltransferase subunit CysN, partial [Xanthobacteraceae bacterium]